MKKLEIVELYLNTKGRRAEFNEFVGQLIATPEAKQTGDAFDKLRKQPRMDYHKFVPVSREFREAG